MTQYDDLAESAAFLVGRDAARDLRSSSAGPDDAEQFLPLGLHPDDEQAWLRGWRSHFG